MRLEHGDNRGDSAAQGRDGARKPRRAQDVRDCSLSARLLGVEDAAAYLGVSHWTIRDLITGGQLARVRLELGGRNCRRLLVDRLELDALVERSKERVSA